MSQLKNGSWARTRRRRSRAGKAVLDALREGDAHAEGLGDAGEECRVDDGGASAAASPPRRSSASRAARGVSPSCTAHTAARGGGGRDTGGREGRPVREDADADAAAAAWSRRAARM